MNRALDREVARPDETHASFDYEVLIEKSQGPFNTTRKALTDFQGTHR